MQGRVKKIYFDNLLDKLRAKIRGWMPNLLSMAGRLTLIRSVLQSLRFHTMAFLPISKGVIKKMKIIISNFLWDYGSTKNHHWIRMELVTRTKETGGLDIRSLSDNMLAFQWGARLGIPSIREFMGSICQFNILYGETWLSCLEFYQPVGRAHLR